MLCTRCHQERPTIPIFHARAGGLPSLAQPLTLAPFQSEAVCADCITNDQIVRLLNPMVVEFVLGHLIKQAPDDSMKVALECARTYFMVRNNEPAGSDRGRRVALKALGL